MTAFPPSYVRLTAGVLRSVLGIARLKTSAAHRPKTGRSTAPSVRDLKQDAGTRACSTNDHGVREASTKHGAAVQPLISHRRPAATAVGPSIRGPVIRQLARRSLGGLDKGNKDRALSPVRLSSATGLSRMRIPGLYSRPSVGAQVGRTGPAVPKRSGAQGRATVVPSSGRLFGCGVHLPVAVVPRPAATSVPPRLAVVGRTNGARNLGSMAPTIDRTSSSPVAQMRLVAMSQDQRALATTLGRSGSQLADPSASPEAGTVPTEIHIDGQLLGQWVVNHLEQTLTQPSTSANFVTNHGLPTWPGQSPFL